MPPVIRAKLGPSPRAAAATAGKPGASGKAGSGDERPVGAKFAPLPAGIAAREMALWLVAQVLDRRRAFDDALAEAFASAKGLAMTPRDRGLARMLAATVLRRRGGIEALLANFLEKPLGEKHADVQRLLMLGAAQMLYLDTPAHAAINLAVAEARRNPSTLRFDKLVNAVLRRVSLEGRTLLADIDVTRLAVPDWMWARWCAAYGEPDTRRIIEASLAEAPLDLSVKNRADAGLWADKLGGEVLANGSVRLPAGGRIEDRDGFAEGAWWVQDAAAALPARLLGTDLAGRSVADLCAAPGGKTAELAATGANVTAVDVSANRMARVQANLSRLGLTADLVTADVTEWAPERTFDAVLLDAPCTATGTIRRHPDILHLKRSTDLEKLAELQRRLLSSAARHVAPGGVLVYCTCSLEPEEGPAQVEAFLAGHPEFARQPIAPGEAGVSAECLTAAGDLRTLPFHSPAGDSGDRGMDGFYAARLLRTV